MGVPRKQEAAGATAEVCRRHVELRNADLGLVDAKHDEHRRRKYRRQELRQQDRRIGDMRDVPLFDPSIEPAD